MNFTPRGFLPRMPYTQDKGQDAVGTYFRGASADALSDDDGSFASSPCLSGDPLVIFCVCMCGVLSCVLASCFGVFTLAFSQQQPVRPPIASPSTLFVFWWRGQECVCLPDPVCERCSDANSACKAFACMQTFVFLFFLLVCGLCCC